MADEVTPTVEKSPEEIERAMLETRESLTVKVMALENQVVGTVQNAADTINDTVQAVRSLVTTAPETVSETLKQAASAVGDTMKDALDISGHVRRHPWAAVGSSALLGCAVGWLVSRRPSLGVPPGYTSATAAYEAPTLKRESLVESGAREERQPGVFDELLGMVGNKVKELARTTLDTVAASIKEGIETGVPKLVGEATARLSDTGNGSGASAFRHSASSSSSGSM